MILQEGSSGHRAVPGGSGTGTQGPSESKMAEGSSSALLNRRSRDDANMADLVPHVRIVFVLHTYADQYVMHHRAIVRDFERGRRRSFQEVLILQSSKPLRRSFQFYTSVNHPPFY